MISEPEILDVREPPGKAMGKVAELWRPIEGTNKIMCTACARYCKIGEGQVGLCGIRGVHEGKLWLYVYGRVITGHVDPIEKKPVSHYRPGSKIFSIATTGCNWLCHPAGSDVLMADGDVRPIEELRPGDWVLTVADVEDEVIAGYSPRVTSHARSAHAAHASSLLEQSHQFETVRPRFGWKKVDMVREEANHEPVYNFETIPAHTYICNGITVHNCRYCQNADISQRRKVEGIEVEPQDVVRMTLEQGCQGLAYTYNQPTIFIEFARDIGMMARKAGLINIFVSNGYDTPETVAEMPKFLDCVTVDFKGSGETNFVRKYINIPNADPIFQTLLDTRDTKKIHIEITDLIVPQVGDDLNAARKLSKWVYDNLGPDTPIHFLRFHPDYKMMEFPWTPVETLEKHCAVAKEEGLKYVYIGNVSGHPLEHTYCPGCGAVAIKRYGFDITGWYLDKDNKCKKCGYQLAIFGRLERTAKENRYYSVLYHR